jgi:hypothetical protein
VLHFAPRLKNFSLAPKLKKNNSKAPICDFFLVLELPKKCIDGGHGDANYGVIPESTEFGGIMGPIRVPFGQVGFDSGTVWARASISGHNSARIV